MCVKKKEGKEGKYRRGGRKENKGRPISGIESQATNQAAKTLLLN